MTVPDPSMTFSLPPEERPLGIQQPLLSSVPLGQSLLQPRFLTPLGARSFTVLDPAVFRSTDRSSVFDWQSPFQESPFFDARESPATDPPGQLPTLQTRSLDSSGSRSSSEAATALPALSTERSQPSIAPSIASPFIPETIPTIERSSAPADTVLSAAPFAGEGSEALRNAPELSVPLLNEPEPGLPEPGLPEPSVLEPNAPQIITETSVATTAATQPIFAQAETNQPTVSPPLPRETIATPAPTAAPLLQRMRADGNSSSTESGILPPSITPTQADDRVALAPSIADPFVDASSEPPLPGAVPEAVPAIISETVSPKEATSSALLPPDVTTEQATTSALPVSASTSPIASATPVADPIASPASITTETATPSIAPLVSESVTAVPEALIAQALTPSDSTAPDSTASAIAPFPLEDATPTEPIHADSVVQRSSAEHTAAPAIAPVATPTTFLPEAFDSVATDSSQPAFSGDRTSSDTSFNATPAETVRLPLDGFSTREMSAPMAEATHELSETAEPGVTRSVDPVGHTDNSFETIQRQLAADATRSDGAEVVQRKPDAVTERQPAELRTSEFLEPAQDEPQAAKAGEQPLDATTIAPTVEPTAARQSDRTVEPVAEPSSSTHPEIQTDRSPSEAVTPLPERTRAEEPSIANNSLDLPSSDLAPLTTSWESDSPIQAKTLEPSAQVDGLEALTQPIIQPKAGTEPIIQPKAKTTVSPAIAPLPNLSEITSAITSTEAVQKDSSATPQSPATEPDLSIPISSVQTGEMVREAVQRQPVELNTVAPVNPITELPEADSREADSPEGALPEANLPKAIAPQNPISDQFTALPALPTTIQRLSVWEPLIQMQPLVASVAPPAIQPVQTSRYPDTASSQSPTLDRAADQLNTPELDTFKPVLPNKMAALTDVVSLKAEAAPAEWSSIAELFQATEASYDHSPPSNATQSNATQSNATQYSAPQPDVTLANGYTDLNLRSDNTALPDTVQRNLDDLPAIAAPPIPTPSAEPASNQQPSSQQNPTQASPEQFERLAQEVYGLVRQRLALERERAGNPYIRRSM